MVDTFRRECLDHLLIVGLSHLARVLDAFACHHNTHRPHRSLNLQPSSNDHDPGRLRGGRSTPS